MILTVLAFVVIGAILSYYPQVEKDDWLLRLALSMQWGGALGNLVDRLTIGHVTDFISVGNFPVFNVADASITIGAVLLFLSVWLRERAEKRAAKPRSISLGKRQVSDRVLNFHFDRQTPERLDRFLVEQLQEFSRSRIQGLVLDGFVDVDGRIAKKAGQTLESGARVTVRIPPPIPTDLVPEEIPLDILFENDDLLAINKPAGMVVHPAAGHASGTLVNAVLGYDPDIEGIGGEERPGVVHRLDKETSGVILLAKNERAHRWLQDQFRLRTVEKTYLFFRKALAKEPSERFADGRAFAAALREALQGASGAAAVQRVQATPADRGAPAPPSTVSEGRAPRRPLRWPYFAGVVLVLAAVAGGSVWLGRGGKEAPAPAAAIVEARVVTEPPGLPVLLDGRPLTTVRVQFAASGPFGTLTATHGCRTASHTLEPSDAQSESVLAPEASRVLLTIDAGVPGAAVFLQGADAGKTPLDLNIDLCSENRIEVRTEGYKPLTSAITAGASIADARAAFHRQTEAFAERGEDEHPGTCVEMPQFRDAMHIVQPVCLTGCHLGHQFFQKRLATPARLADDHQRAGSQRPAASGAAEAQTHFPLSVEPPGARALAPVAAQPRLARAQRAVRPASEPADWAEAELGQAQLGDQRLRQRLLVIARDFYARPQSNLPQSCNGDRAKTKAAYRFFDHEQVSMEAVLRSHWQLVAISSPILFQDTPLP